jgi:hypothetical protein
MTLVALALAVGGSATPGVARPAAGARTLPAHDPFYRYTGAQALGSIPRGTILKRRTVTVTVGGARTARATQLLYRTRDERRRPAVSVTTVIQPATAALAAKVVAYLSFYDALSSRCDPSFTLAGGDSGTANNRAQARLESGLIESYLAVGDIVTVPDFEGTDLHWFAGHEAGWSALDAIRATEAELKLSRRAPVGLTGYSGGSIAADWAAELAPHYAPGLHLVGVAAGGVPVDIAHNLDYIDGSRTWSGIMPGILVGLGRAYGVDLSPYLSRYGTRLTNHVAGECIGSFNGAYPHLRMRQLLRRRFDGYRAVAPLRRIVNRLIMGSVAGHPHVPVLLVAGRSDPTGDGVMVTRDVQGLAHEYCRQGVHLSFTVLRGDKHGTAGVKFANMSAQFLAGRFAGLPFRGNCATIGHGNSLRPIPAPRR